MQAFKNFTGLVAPLDRPNVDTDQVIPKQFLKAVVRSGLGKGLFYDWRNQPDSQFVLEQPRFRKATILVARANFGCGSSREHAPWALTQFGFRAVVSTSFADIFKQNALKNGLLPIVVPAEIHAALIASPGAIVEIDLEKQTITLKDGSSAEFPIDQFSKHCLLEGVDELGYILSQSAAIESYEQRRGI
jgi:3-isopropylmalate/(R)-2-methylmalate dehydratase small subunit